MLVEDIREKLPIKNIPAIIGETIYKAINEVWEVLYANAASIRSTLGEGRNGLIGIIMEGAVYANVSTTAYTRPTEPGPYKQHGQGDSAAAQADANAIHKEGRRIYDLNENVESVLKQEIIAAAEETYLSAKNEKYMVFTAYPPRTS